MFEGGDEELGAPRSGAWWWRVGSGVAVAVVVAAVVVGLVRHQDSTPSASPTTGATAGGPVIPTFSKLHPGPDDVASETLEAGRQRLRATLYGPVPLLQASCIGTQCVARYGLPVAVTRAVHTVVPGCRPALSDLVRRRPGHRTRTEDRSVICVQKPTTLVVNIARAHSSVAEQGRLDGGSLVYTAHVHGQYTVQVFLQQRNGPLPDLATARALTKDPRLLAGI